MRPHDAEAVAALIRRAFAAQPVALDPPASALRVTAETITEHLRCGGGAVAEQGGIVGAVLWTPKPHCAYLARLSVDPAARRQGIARLLMAEAERAIRTTGAIRIHLGTRLALHGNRTLFVACGFTEVAHHAHPGYPAPTWVEMEKRLGSSEIARGETPERVNLAAQQR